MTALIRIDDLARDYADAGRVLGPVSFEIGRGELLVVVGPSGGGKSTLLRCLAGLEQPDAGEIRWVAGRGEIGVVFQEPRLMPWLDVAANVGFGLRGGRTAVRSRVDELLRLVDLTGAGERLPKQLSGGMAQRAALARGLATDPDLLLLDEPFSALDPANRSRLQAHLRSLQSRLGTTMVLVTHDVAEAVRLGDRILVLGGRPGRLIATLPGSETGATEAGAARLRAYLGELLRADAVSV
jgi:ABC-type nitrate/sulfonate/bicarbonate transport system ATPase subunit